MELCRSGHEVTVLEAAKGFARDAHRMASLGLLEESKLHKNLHAYDLQKVTEITETGVKTVDAEGIQKVYPADTVIYAVGMRARTELPLALGNAAPYVAFAGDCVRPRRTMEAIREGYFAAMNIE
jgi:2,4-dienoyl-CoA reductase (NADPH2)